MNKSHKQIKHALKKKKKKDLNNKKKSLTRKKNSREKIKAERETYLMEEEIRKITSSILNQSQQEQED
tara:strand:- start:179 stop:382 length:204 start_codon:yes stop_codon:yes gene_type:complete